MLTSSRSRGRRTCIYEMLERIWGEIDTELQICWGTCWGAGLHNRQWRTYYRTSLFYSSRPGSMNFCRGRTYSCIMIIIKTSRWWQYDRAGWRWNGCRLGGQVVGLKRCDRWQVRGAGLASLWGSTLKVLGRIQGWEVCRLWLGNRLLCYLFKIC
jgi:hypothetical protein